jgi:hypothetical protein
MLVQKRLSFRYLSINICCFLLFLLSPFLNQLKSQARIEASDYDGSRGAGGYTFYGMVDELSKARIPYSRIKGSPFWKDEWQLATIYSGPKKIFTIPVRLNIATNEIYFLKNDQEYILDANDISGITFHSGSDSSTVATRFIMNDPYIFLNNKKVNGFVQELNPGKYRLLKYISKKLSSIDSLFNTQKRYFFINESFYYFWFDGKIERIKKLNRDNIIKFLPSALSYTNWINENKIDFRKENDVIQFLNYYNTHPPK